MEFIRRQHTQQNQLLLIDARDRSLTDRLAKLSMAYKVLVLKGDGIGPEVVGEALQVLKVVARQAAIDIEFKEGIVGGHAMDAYGTPLPPRGFDASRRIATRSCSAPSAGRNGTILKPSSAPSRRCCTCAKNWGCSPTAAGEGGQGVARFIAAQAGNYQRCRPCGHSRIDRRNLLRQTQRMARGRRMAARRSIPASIARHEIERVVQLRFRVGAGAQKTSDLGR